MILPGGIGKRISFTCPVRFATFDSSVAMVPKKWYRKKKKKKETWTQTPMLKGKFGNDMAKKNGFKRTVVFK